jgi:hypothetical protein
MKTYSHGIIGYLLYFKGTHQQRLLVVIGAMVPDLLLAIGYPFHIINYEFLHNLFHHSFLHTITEYMHSFLIVLPLFVIAWLLYKTALPFFVGMLSHGAIDLLTHQRWGYNHFLPIPLDPIMGLFSYTSLWFTIVEHIFVLTFVVWIIRRRLHHKRNKSRKKKQHEE